MPDPILLLGAEKQAASSIALAYPERSFVFVTDQPVVDGWDLPNVKIRYGSPSTFNPGDSDTIMLCPRWASASSVEPRNVLGSFDSSVVISRLHTRFGDIVNPVSSKPFDGVANIVKGDRFHRPDGTLTFSSKPADQIEDPSGAGILYQAVRPKSQTMLAVGRRWKQCIKIGFILVHGETCARDEWITSGETSGHTDLYFGTRAFLSEMDYVGFFTFNWIIPSKGEPSLTSFRPVPRAVFATLRRAGVDLLEEEVRDAVATFGIKFVVDLKYASYRPLGA